MEKVKCFLLCFLGTGVFAQTIPFKDITKTAGIEHHFEVYEGMFGGGACVLDFNKDGFEDFFVAGGVQKDALYKNNGNGTFTDIYEQSGLIQSKKYVTQGASSADVNRDGWVDILVTTITTKGKKLTVPRAMNLLFLNQGNGTFRDATKEYKLDQLLSFSTGASFADINYDGFPDLFIGNYFNDFRGELTFINDATIVGATQTSKAYLLINKGGKYFEDAYEDYGLNHKGFGFGGVFSDFDNDGDQDLIINHDFGYKRTPNLLLERKGGSFEDVAPKFNMDLAINAMGTAIGDIDNDGIMEYYFTNIRFNRFMGRKSLDQPFSDMNQSLGMNFMSISWGANFVDFDNDGDVDLFVANGDLNPNCVPMADFYFENTGGKFQDKAPLVGLNDYGIGRGSVFFDIENDGDLDLLVVNQKPILDYPISSFTRLYRNDLAKGNWLKISLSGVSSESHGLGARVEVRAGGKLHVREVDGGSSSHISQNSTILHFGLGKASTIDSITIIWPGGKKQLLTNQKANKHLTITESADESFTTWWVAGILLALVIGFFLFKLT